MSFDVIVIGAGAAGLLAAARAAERGRSVLLLEKNRKAGVKILMSGGSRCNLTQNTDARGIVEAFGRPGRFLHSALAALGPADVVDLFEAEGVATKVEETGKVFPVSDRSTDVLQALLRRLKRSGAVLALNEGVAEIRSRPGGFEVITAARTLFAARVVLSAGGQSYPGCGTTGDGYAWARALGHTVATPRPALVPLSCRLPWVAELKGITMPDVAVRVDGPGVERERASRRGSLLFTHFGISGPVVMDVSRAFTVGREARPPALVVDLFPDLSEADLAAMIGQRCREQGRMQVGTTLTTWLPRRLVDVLLPLAGLAAEARGADLTRASLARLVANVHAMALPIHGTLGFPKAEVTAGGIALDEVDSRTMQSRLVPGLFAIGEILDLDGPIGGYNFQCAFSTGFLAGDSV